LSDLSIDRWQKKEEIHERMNDPRIDVVTSLVNSIRISSDDSKPFYLRQLWNLLVDDQYKAILIRSDVTALSLLVELIHSSTPAVIQNALGCLWFLSRAHKIPLLKPSLGLLPILVDAIEIDHANKEYCIKIITNCSITPLSHKFLLLETLNYVSICKKEVVLNWNSRFPFQAFHCLATGIKEEHIPILLQHNIHETIMNKLFSVGNDLSLWPNRGSGAEYYSLNFITNLSFSISVASALRQLNIKDYFLPFLKLSGSIEQIKALCILSNVYGKNQSSDSNETMLPELTNLFTDRPLILKFVANILLATVDQNTDLGKAAEVRRELDETNYHFGMIRLRTLMKMMRNLSYSRSNSSKIFFYRSKNHPDSLFEVLLAFLRQFVQGEEELSSNGSIALEYAGGGKDDEDTVRFLLELLIQLRFLFPPESDELPSKFCQNTLKTYCRELLGLPATSGRVISPEIIHLTNVLLSLIEA
jgi:hypothetical protein